MRKITDTDTKIILMNQLLIMEMLSDQYKGYSDSVIINELSSQIEFIKKLLEQN